MVMDRPFTTASPVQANFDYNDISSGLGYVTFYPNISKNSTETGYILTDQVLPTATTTGIFITEGSFKFKGSTNKLPKTVSGIAYFSGYADYSANNMTIAGQVSILKDGTPVDGGLGSVTASDMSSVSEASGSGYVLKKTIWVNDYVNKVTGKYWTSDGGVSSCTVKIILKRFDGTADETLTTAATTETDPYPYTLSTATPLVRVGAVEVWITGSAGGANVSERDTEVYANIVTGITETTISDLITSETHGADSGFLLQIPLTESILTTSDQLVLSIYKTGATGGYVVDPSQSIATNETLKLNIPFKLDL